VFHPGEYVIIISLPELVSMTAPVIWLVTPVGADIPDGSPMSTWLIGPIPLAITR
jgi:hypothetical protein